VRSLRPAELRRRWGEFQALRTDLFDAGGVTIDSPPNQVNGSPIHARTVVQPDGDVVWMVDERVVADLAQLRAHTESVIRWYESASDTVTTLGLYLRTVLTGLSASLGVIVGIGSMAQWDWRGGAVALVVALVAEPIGRWVIGRLMRKGMSSIIT
jgi:hypothetical protein